MTQLCAGEHLNIRIEFYLVYSGPIIHLPDGLVGNETIALLRDHIIRKLGSHPGDWAVPRGYRLKLTALNPGEDG